MWRELDVDGVPIKYIVCRRDTELIVSSVAIRERFRGHHNLLRFSGLGNLNYGARINPSLLASKWDAIVR